MNNPAVNKIIIVAGIVLVVLIIVSLIVSGSLSRNDDSTQRPTLVPTGFFESGGDIFTQTRDLSPEEIRELERKTEQTNTDVLSLDQANKLQEFKAKLPVIDDDFELGYSEALGQFFIQKKTQNADSELDNFLRSNDFLDIYQQFPNFFVTTNQSVSQAIQQAEQNFANVKDEFQQQEERRLTPTHSPSPKRTKAKQDQIDRDQRMLQSFFQGIGSLLTLRSGDSSNIRDLVNPTQAPQNTGGGSNATQGTTGGGGGGSSGSFTDRQISQAMMDILLEAGNRVNIAPKLLAAIMSRECGRVLYAPQNWITNNPVLSPNHFCYDNGVAQGVMQFIPTTWAGWAPRVRDILNLNAPANVQNIRHAVFGAAFKLKAAAQARDPFDLSRDEVLRAARFYNPAGCPTYCEDVWTYYNNH